MSEKILLIQKKRLGDVLLTTPAVRALKKYLGDHEITYVVGESSAEILKVNPYIDHLEILPDGSGYRQIFKLAGRLRKRHFAAAVDFMGHPQTAILVLFSGAPIRIGFDHSSWKWAYNRPVRIGLEPSYSAWQKLQLLSPLGVKDDGLGLDFHLGDGELEYAADFLQEKSGGRRVVVILPTSRRPARRWPAERFAAAADLIRTKTGLLPLLIWGPGEREELEGILSLMGTEGLIAPPTTIRQMAAFCRLARAVITNNNGPMHVARSQGTPVIALFGATSPANWSPGGSGNRDLVAGVDCLFCGRSECKSLKCMWEITPEMVLEALLDVIEEKPEA